MHLWCSLLYILPKTSSPISYILVGPFSPRKSFIRQPLEKIFIGNGVWDLGARAGESDAIARTRVRDDSQVFVARFHQSDFRILIWQKREWIKSISVFLALSSNFQHIRGKWPNHILILMYPGNGKYLLRCSIINAEIKGVSKTGKFCNNL